MDRGWSSGADRGGRRAGISLIRRGDIRWFRFSAPDKKRPVLVLGRNAVLPSLSQVPVSRANSLQVASQTEPRMSNNKDTLALHAHTMRQAPTESEARPWRTPSGIAKRVALRSSQLGVAFRRQVPLLGFIADFYAPSARLIVEVDGGYHTRRVAADARRDRKLARAGYQSCLVGYAGTRRSHPGRDSPARSPGRGARGAARARGALNGGQQRNGHPTRIAALRLSSPKS